MAAEPQQPLDRAVTSGAPAVKLALALGAALLSACALLPTSGPSRSEVQASTHDTGIEIIDVTDGVARQLLESRRLALFSDTFRAQLGTNEIINPGDVLETSVWEAPPAALFSTVMQATAPVASNMTVFPQQMVHADGTIYVPFVGAVTAAGKTAREIADEIARQLRGKAHEPQVLVRLVVNNTAYVTVVGEVTNSTRLPLTPRGEHLLDALAAAGGTKEPVDKVTLQLTRGAIVHSLPLDTVIRDPQQNIALQPGDVVTALYQPLSFTALGATGKSDEVNFEARGITLAQALARVGGLLDTRSNARGVFIFRFERPDALAWPKTPVTAPDGKVPVVYRVDLKDPRSFFVAQSFPMRDKDVLYVANAPGAEMQKFMTLLVSTIYPIDRAITLSQ